MFSRREKALSALLRFCMSLLLMVDLRGFTLAGYLVPGNLQYVAMIMLHPYFFRRLLGVEISPRQAVWASFGVFLHPLGIIYDFYGLFWWWDNLTHIYGGAILAAAGFIVFDALGAKRMKPWVRYASTFLLVAVSSVLWEIFELYLSGVLTFYGDLDAATDFLYNALGWILVAASRWNYFEEIERLRRKRGS